MQIQTILSRPWTIVLCDCNLPWGWCIFRVGRTRPEILGEGILFTKAGWCFFAVYFNRVTWVSKVGLETVKEQSFSWDFLLVLHPVAPEISQEQLFLWYFITSASAPGRNWEVQGSMEMKYSGQKTDCKTFGNDNSKKGHSLQSQELLPICSSFIQTHLHDAAFRSHSCKAGIRTHSNIECLWFSCEYCW